MDLRSGVQILLCHLCCMMCWAFILAYSTFKDSCDHVSYVYIRAIGSSAQVLSSA